MWWERPKIRVIVVGRVQSTKIYNIYMRVSTWIEWPKKSYAPKLWKWVLQHLLSTPEFFQIFWSDLGRASACARESYGLKRICSIYIILLCVYYSRKIKESLGFVVSQLLYITKMRGNLLCMQVSDVDTFVRNISITLFRGAMK